MPGNKGIYEEAFSKAEQITRKYLAAAEKSGHVVNVAEDIPKSFVVCQGADGMTVYLSQMSPQTLFKRFLEAI